MYDAMYTQDHCETIGLSQNNIADGEGQLVVIRGAFLVRSLSQASESFSWLPRTAACFRLAVVVTVAPTRGTVAFPSRLIVGARFVVSPRASPGILLLLLIVLLGSLGVSFLALESASNVNQQAGCVNLHYVGNSGTSRW